MRATILTSEFPPFVYGGVGIHLKYLTEQLTNHIHLDVRYFGTESTVSTDMSVTPFSPWQAAQDADVPTLAKVLAPLSTDVAMVAKEIDADLLHAHTWYTFFAGYLAKLLYGVPLIVTVHSLEPKRPWKREQLGRGYELSTWLERVGIENADAVIAVSSEMRKDILDLYDVSPERVTVIYNGVDVEKYRSRTPVDVRRKFGITGPFILFVGRISRQKGTDVLLKAAENLNRDVTLVLAATSPDTEELLLEVTERVKSNPRVLWINEMVDEETLVSLYSEAEVFVCPSVYEPFGIINLEAMACGTPVVASGVGGILEVVLDGETGILVPPSDPDALATALNDLLSDKSRREAFSNVGRKRVEDHFSWEIIGKRTLDLYRKVAST